MPSTRTRSEAGKGGAAVNLFGAMEVSGSALEAERIRAEVVAANMANADTTRTPEGGPYLKQHVVFTSEAPTFADQMMRQMGGGLAGEPPDALEDGSEIGGVRVSAVVSDPSAVLRRYDPGNPDADGNGYVTYPDINPVTEMVDLMGATRSYGLNASAVEAEKSMISASIDILK